MQIKKIELIVNIDPRNSYLSVEGRLIIKKSQSDFVFFLNSELIVEKLLLQQNDELPLEFEKVDNHDEFFNAANSWKILFPNKIKIPSNFNLIIKYSGKIKIDNYKTNYLTPESIELACYAAWYPIVSLDDRPSFSVKLKGPEHWIWKMNAVELEKNIWDTNFHASDLTLLGRPLATSISDPNSRFWGNIRHYEKFKKLEKRLLVLEERLKTWLGSPNSEEMTFALFSRESGGMYVRRGLLVMQDTLPDKYFTSMSQLLLLSWTHELCHMWFNKSPVSSYHNWIDEALSDYSALIVAKDEFGDEFFTNKIEKIKSQLKDTGDLPSIKSITRSHEKAEIVYYKWGSLVLHELCRLMGFENFKNTVKDFAKKTQKIDVSTTHDFNESIKTITGQDWNNFIEKKLGTSPYQ